MGALALPALALELMGQQAVENAMPHQKHGAMPRRQRGQPEGGLRGAHAQQGG